MDDSNTVHAGPWARGAPPPFALPVREKFAYGVGDFASSLVFQTVGTFLMFFYTDVYGLSAAVVGTLLFAARTADAVWDIYLGTLIDRTGGRWGQCRPYLLFGAPLLGVCAIATFSVPDGGAQFKLFYAYASYMLLMMAYSVVNIPYGALPALMTDDARDRTRLASWRMFCAFSCAILVNTSMVKLVEYLGAGDQRLGYQRTVVAMAIAGTLLFWLCFAGVRERVPPLVQDKHVRRDLRTLLAGRAWWMMALIGTCMFTAVAITNGSAMYYFRYVVGDTARAAPYFLCAGLGNLTGIVLSSQLTRRYCKRRVMLLASLGAALLYAGFYFVDPAHPWALYLLGYAITCVGGISLPIVFSMVADTADDAELRSGRRMVGLTASTIGFAIKLGLGLGGAVTGIILTLVGYQANAAQSAQAIEGMKLIMSAVPATGKLLVCAIVLFYPLGQKKLDEIGPLLRRARAGLGAA